jgi:hypothetical protein
VQELHSEGQPPPEALVVSRTQLDERTPDVLEVGGVDLMRVDVIPLRQPRRQSEAAELPFRRAARMRDHTMLT